jgi:spermidine/putrescine ABC transporter ATP-binding subunit
VAFRAAMGSAAGLSLGFLLLPILALVPMSLSRSTWLAFPPDALTLEWYGRVLADREWREAAGTSMVVAALAGLMAALLGTPAGLALGRARFTPGVQRALRTVVLLPVMVPVVLVAIALYAAFAAAGLGGTLAALVLAHTALGVPYVVLSVEAAARALDPRLDRAARTLGATPWQALRRVTLPLVRRGLVTGALFAVIVSLDEVVVALFVGGPTATTLPRKMWSTITQDEFNPLLTAVASLQMIVALGLLGVVARLGARDRRGDDRVPEDPSGGRVAPSPAATLASRGADPATREGARLTLAGLTKRFGVVTAVDGLTLEVEPGELLTLLGPSGCGKTTVLNLIAGFETADHGTILVDGADVAPRPPHRREIGMVFQDYALFPHLTVRENVAFPLRVRGTPGPEATVRVDRMLDLVRLPGYGDRLPRELSGGQQQRVALARALVFRPRVLLMDEPFGALDRALREAMRGELRELHRALGITVVLVTHDQDEAMDLSDRVAVMRAGRLQQVAAPRALYERPVNAFVAGFVGDSNLLDGVVVSAEGEGAVVRTAGGRRIEATGRPARAGDRVLVLLRPEGAAIAEDAGVDDGGLVGIVEDVADPGPVERGQVRLDGGERVTVIRPRRAGGPALRRGMRIRLAWPPDEVRLLAPEP